VTDREPAGRTEQEHDARAGLTSGVRQHVNALRSVQDCSHGSVATGGTSCPGQAGDA